MSCSYAKSYAVYLMCNETEQLDSVMTVMLGHHSFDSPTSLCSHVCVV